jgi:ankyrin repeat protein
MDNASIIELFCDSNIDLNIKNEDGHTPLMYAAYNGYNETVNHLTLRTKNLDIEDRKGNTLMLIYILKRNQEMINKILSRGAHINFRNQFGITPLLFAIRHELPEDIVHLLVKKGADLHL